MAERAPARIAVVGPFGGPRAAWGKLLRESAVAHHHPAIGWEFHDDRGDEAIAVDVAKQVADDGGYTAVIGHFNSSGARDALPLYRRAGLPVLLPLATRPGLLDSYGGTALRWCPDDIGQLAALCTAASQLGHRELVVTDDGSEYGRGLAALFRRLPTSPVEVCYLHEFAATPHHSWSAISAMVVCGTHFGAADTARQLRAAGFEGQLFFTDDCAVEEFVELLGDIGGLSRTVRLLGGASQLVDAAFAALTVAVTASPARSTAALLAAVRARATVAFTADGDPPGASSGTGWEVVPVASTIADVPHPTTRPVRPTGSAADGATPRYDVVVVGAGVIGTATAAALAESGARVAIAAPHPEAPSATRYSGGLVRAYEADPGIRALAVRSHRLLWGQDPNEVTAASGFRRTGSLVLLGPEDLAEAERGIAELTAANIRAEFLSAADVQAHWPDLSVSDLSGAVWEPDGGYASPPQTAAAYLARARQAGAIELPAGLIHRLVSDADGVQLLADYGPITAAAAVIAAGSSTPALLADRLSAYPQLESARTKRIRYAFFRLNGRQLPALSDLTSDVWGRPQLDGPAAGGFLAGRPVQEWNVPVTGGETLTEKQIRYIREGVGHRLPWITGAEFISGRFGTDLYRAGGPLLGALPEEPRISVAACWSGAGFKVAPAAAELAATTTLSLLNETRKV